MSVQALRAGALAFVGLAPATASAEWGVNLPYGVTPVSQAIYDIHMLIFWICVAIGVGVFLAMFWSIIAYRKSKGAKPANFHENTTVEIIWSVVPLLILVGMAVPATQTLVKMYDTSNAELDIKVTGYQWRWRYEYLEEDIDFFSNPTTPRDQIRGLSEKGENYLMEVDNHLVIPANRKVRFLITANDVIHSWWVPEFGVKQDAIPGFVNETWAKVQEPGIYRGLCAELCGQGHAFMPIVVEVLSEEDYDQWMADQIEATHGEAAAAEADREWSKDELMASGEEVYGTACASCHQADGSGAGPFPALLEGSLATGPIDEHIDVIVNGVRGSAMQAFDDQLSESEIAAVITYTRNAWGNDTGDVVTPQDIQEFKENQ